MIEYYKKLTVLRENKGFSQSQVAKVLGVSQITYGYYELGRKEMDVKSLYRLCKLYNISADWFLGLEENKDKQIEINQKTTKQKKKSLFKQALDEGEKAFISSLKEYDDKKKALEEKLEEAKEKNSP